MIDYDAAVSEMSALFKSHWDANTIAIAGYVPQVVWPRVKLPNGQTAPDANAELFWVRFSTQNVDEPQTAMGACETEFNKRYTAYGLIFIQLFCPKSVDNSNEIGMALSVVARNAFRGKKTAGGIWFRNVRINDSIPDEKMCYRFNVVAEYEYDEVG